VANQLFLPRPSSHFFATWDMNASDQSQSSRFQVIFESALQDYEKQTGTVLAKHPLAEQLENCHTVESVAAVLREQAQASSEFRGDGRLMRSLNRIVSVLHTLSTNNLLYNAAGLVCRYTVMCPSPVTLLLQLFPPSKAIISGLAILLSVCAFSSSYAHIVVTKRNRRSETWVLTTMHSSTCSRRSNAS
jgi:hypothetical protein